MKENIKAILAFHPAQCVLALAGCNISFRNPHSVVMITIVREYGNWSSSVVIARDLHMFVFWTALCVVYPWWQNFTGPLQEKVWSLTDIPPSLLSPIYHCTEAKHPELGLGLSSSVLGLHVP